MAHVVSLTAGLAILWLLLSGHYDPLLLSFGAGSCLFVVYVAHRMDVVDHEGHPVHLTWRLALYWPWLFWEIVKSNIAVARIVLDPKLPIAPRIIKAKASQKSDLGRVVFANSITLTPGTVSIWVYPDHIEVHALDRSFDEDLQSGEMDRRASAVEGKP